MAVKVIKTVFQFRRATDAEWLLNKDVVPAEGEPCFVTDKNILKIGDGHTTFENLEPIGGVKFELAADGKSIVLEDNVFKLMGFNGAEVGAQPIKAADGSLEWVVPSNEIVDSLQSAVADLQSDVETLNTDVSGLKTDVTDLRAIVGTSDVGTDTLLSRVEGLEKDVNTLVHGFTPDDEKVNTMMELIEYVDTHGKEAAQMVSDISALYQLVGTDPVADQIAKAIKNSGHMDKAEAEATLLSKVEAHTIYNKVKYEITDAPAGTLVDYRDKEIRVMVPVGAKFNKQTVGSGGDANTYYVTFKTYAPDNAVGYVEHLGNQVDGNILTDLKVDAYGRKYQPTWLGVAKYDDASGWTYYGKNSTVKHYIGWDYQIDWYDANDIVIASDKIRINLSNESCHNVVEPYYMANTVKEIAVNGTLLDMVDGRVDISVPNIKGSDEIEVAEDGTLSIKYISFSKIAQDNDEVIIMDGGSAV